MERVMGFGSWRENRRGQSAKMGNIPTRCSRDHSHRSGLESAVCELLKLRERAGELKLIQAEATVYLGPTRVRRIPDFKCELPSGELLFVEAKGKANDNWPTTKKLWKAFGPGRLEIWRGSKHRPLLTEIIEPLKGVCPTCGMRRE